MSKPLVGIVMGSKSDWPTLRHASEMLASLEVPHECRVVSAHRTPDAMADYAKTAHERGLRVIIAGAGGAAHLPGMIASHTTADIGSRIWATGGVTTIEGSAGVQYKRQNDFTVPDAIGAYWGEINTSIHKSFGLAGTLTDGVMRDLGDLPEGKWRHLKPAEIKTLLRILDKK